MSYAVHCDNQSCDTWTFDADNSDFLTLTYSDGMSVIIVRSGVVSLL